MTYKLKHSCRICGGSTLKQYLDLGELPLTNNLCVSFFDVPDNYPLQVNVCTDCWWSQLSIVVDPALMFSNYVYRSSISESFKRHCRDMARDLKSRYHLNEDCFHIDIAGNDAALLNEFRQEIGLKILNVDPAQNLAAICQAREVPMFTEFWSDFAARKAVKGFGQADLITATNVLAHVDNLDEFFEAVRIALKPTGVLIVECPYLIDFIENIEFATVYQEHLSYVSIAPLQMLCRKHGFNIMRVEAKDIHCGSVRIHIGYGKSDDTVEKFINAEQHYHHFEPYEQFANKSHHIINEFKFGLNKLKSEGKKIAAFGCSAKGNTLMNAASVGIGAISYIVDETPGKIGMWSPGTKIPVVSMLELQSNPPDYLVILAWNFTNEIIEKVTKAGYTGKYIVPLPSFKIL